MRMRSAANCAFYSPLVRSWLAILETSKKYVEVYTSYHYRYRSSYILRCWRSGRSNIIFIATSIAVSYNIIPHIVVKYRRSYKSLGLCVVYTCLNRDNEYFIIIYNVHHSDIYKNKFSFQLIFNIAALLLCGSIHKTIILYSNFISNSIKL